MPKYAVEVEVTNRKTLTIFAQDENVAKIKAENIISKWDGVIDFDIKDVEQE